MTCTTGDSGGNGGSCGDCGRGGNGGDGTGTGGKSGKTGDGRNGVDVKGEVELYGVEAREGLVVVGNETLVGNEKVEGAGVVSPVLKPLRSKVDESCEPVKEERSPLRSQVAGRRRGVLKMSECASSGFNEPSCDAASAC